MTATQHIYYNIIYIYICTYILYSTHSCERIYSIYMYICVFYIVRYTLHSIDIHVSMIV